MNGFKPPCHSILSSLLAAALLLLTGLAQANDSGATPFLAEYDVYRSGTHVAESRFQLQQQNDNWIWKMQTRPHGIYRWLTRKKPFTETRMLPTADGLKLGQVSSGDYADKPPAQSAWFDHADKTIFYTQANSETPRKLALPDPVFSFHSVHLLYQVMKSAGMQKMEIDFYKKGELYRSTLTMSRGVPLPMAESATRVDMIVQELAGSNRKMAYYYQGHELAPAVIEQIKNGETINLMKRRSLQ